MNKSYVSAMLLFVLVLMVVEVICTARELHDQQTNFSSVARQLFSELLLALGGWLTQGWESEFLANTSYLIPNTYNK